MAAKAEAPTALAEATATGDTLTQGPDTDSILGEVRAYQRAARRLVRDPSLSFIQASMAILRLIQEGRKTEDPETTCAAIWSEVRGFVGTGDRPTDREALVEALHASDPVDLTIRRLLRDGYARCPRCTRLLPTEDQLDRRRALARQSLEEALLKENAL